MTLPRFKKSRWKAALAGILCMASFSSAPAVAQELFQDGSDLTAIQVEKLYLKGLGYLAKNQTEDGSWPDRLYGQEPAVVSLAVVSLLAHGDDPNFGPYSKQIRKGVDFVLKQANSETGYIGRSMYNHGFSTLMLAEAYGAVEDARLGPALQKAVRLIVNSQAKNPLGAWRYGPESQDADTTVSGAQLMALFAARNAGIAVKDEAIQRGIQFLQRCQTAEGGVGYTSAVGPNGARTAIAALVLSIAKDKKSASYQKAVTYLKNSTSDGLYAQYYLYYASQAFFQAGPASWNDWNRRNVKALADSQNADGSWEGQFGPTFSTAASLLSMALNYRFLPIYER